MLEGLKYPFPQDSIALQVEGDYPQEPIESIQKDREPLFHEVTVFEAEISK